MMPERAKFLPPDGQTLLIVGQDVGAVRDYTAVVWAEPGGITTYTSISEYSHNDFLHGLDNDANWGSGDVNGQTMLDENPNSVLVIGLNIVDHSGRNLIRLADGSRDSEIDRLGAFIVAADRPVFVRIGYEFDGPWNHHDPEQYIAAYRYMVDRWHQTGVDNVATVWQSATSVFGSFRDLPFGAWYPGDDYVDWMGTSYFEGDRVIHDAFLDFAREHNKPVMIAEATPQGYDVEQLTFAPVTSSGELPDEKGVDGVWSGWYEPFFSYVHDNGDVIRAVAYINVDWKNQPMWGPNGGNGYWGDSRVQANDTIRERWLAEISTNFWLHGSPELFELLGY